MKRLILMRHAKSDWSELDASDHERTLNERGIRSATAIGRWLQQNALLPDHILCSDAARTQQTLELLALPETPTTFTRSLYLAQAEVMARKLSKQVDDCILLVAHNPGIAVLAERLVSQPPQDAQFDSFPTCATFVVDFQISAWSDLKMGMGAVQHFIVPRTQPHRIRAEVSPRPV